MLFIVGQADAGLSVQGRDGPYKDWTLFKVGCRFLVAVSTDDFWEVSVGAYMESVNIIPRLDIDETELVGRNSDNGALTAKPPSQYSYGMPFRVISRTNRIFRAVPGRPWAVEL